MIIANIIVNKSVNYESVNYKERKVHLQQCYTHEY